MQTIQTSTPRPLSPFFNPATGQLGLGGAINWERVTRDFLTGKVSVTVNGAVAADAVLVPVDPPLKQDIPAGTLLQAGADEYITTTEDRYVGDADLAIEPLTTALEDNDVLVGDATGFYDGKFIPAGTVMARDKDNGLLIPRAVANDAAEVALGFIVSDAQQGSKSDAKSGYGLFVGNLTVYENLCPDADVAGDLPADYKTELAANSGGFVFVDWEDSRI